MQKYFINVAATYTAKNKLQKLLLEKSKNLAFTLCDSLEHAKKAVDELYEQAVAEYKGSAQEPLPDYYEDVFFIGGGVKLEGIMKVNVMGCLRLELLPVLNDHSTQLLSEENQRKIEKHDKLEAYLEKAYAEGEDDGEPESEQYDLLSIGEEAASIFGWL